MMTETAEHPNVKSSTGQRAGNGRLSRSVAGKVVFVSIVALLLLIPLSWVRSLVREREGRHEEAIREISSIWGKEQLITGPILTVPYRIRLDAEENGSRQHPSLTAARFLPDDLRVEGMIRPERRYYGIFDVIVYQVELQISGTFPPPALGPDLEKRHVAEEDVLWDQATIAVGIPDVRGISRAVSLDWGDLTIDFQPGTGATSLPSGIHAAVGDPRATQPIGARFSFTLSLNGSRRFRLLPLGKQTTVHLVSSWPSPSFSGSYLPASRTVSDSGFDATWEIPYFGRSYPQSWTLQQETSELRENLSASAFGVELLIPVDLYQKTTRSVKYGLLFIGLTFLSFFLVELFNPIRMHPFQYLLVGFAICLFYLLLLSLAEHIGFGFSYLVSTVATVLLVAGYCRSALRGWIRSVLMTLVLTGLYGFLWLLLIGEDYSLLSGSLGLFVILAVVMYLTRRLDWYTLEMTAQSEATGTNLETDQGG